ncbi:oxidoreductase [Acanthopleuribacter pedis]|uniref:SDR family NAD(P)-dependent oxidoreductase n=1 Tax=Acanthopleuribacter pedis TaxID=442870 RepID=A0A8J7QAV0_9BACT|nr:oxidoreductase [Acanthopleuribacter pedis]MBO1320694.1 SDR family NAD(P)-dependent oxidoreductase [Acanthopleuribacter pedis]
MVEQAGKKVVLVTGASAGIGQAIVLKMRSEGWIVYGAARRVNKMDELVAAGAKAVFIDVTDDASMAAAVETILAAEGRLDALVNNAGYGSYGALEDVPIDEARRQFEVNVFGLMRLTQLVLPAMRAAGSGTIMNISSMGGRIWMPIGGWYHATKHALEVLSDALRVEVQPFGVKVVVIQPGAIQSEWSDISADNLDTTTKNSVYRFLTEPMSRILRGYASAKPPGVIADTVAVALAAKNPRRRYRAPFDAKLYVRLHWLFPDWLWERVLRSSMGWTTKSVTGSGQV